MTEIAYFESQDGLLAYRDAGPRDGRALVLLHTGFTDSSQFENLIPGLVALGHRVVAPDARGHGLSANATRAFRQTDDLAALLAHLGLRQVVLVGISMGALIAVDTAVEHPELVRALVVSGRGLGEPDLGDPWAASVAEKQVSALAAGDLDGYFDGFLQWIPGDRRSLDEIDPAITAQVRAMALRTMLKHTPDEPNHAVPVADLAIRAKEIAVPVLAINGGYDVPGIRATADELIRVVPNGRTVLLEEAGHYTTMEAPAEFTRVLADFLAGIDAA
ncbi:alpha/beta fold hydrolase [Streptacidiphilus jiangxiensis]|uniref:Pimeloyl-ACP methyl ester carboxylesterase n=1 Tax=Streptacidiphilus jiangxiensis TaxID=235985 RepID=A0A1H7G7U3_STRJI|nr:alpha/beta hydrolase [Streptacidiphilus jiangxiensis]SEK34219.1 Pimeloyl-ACP methyl ester carboxylesterase [Streptacidiphilus jiangxiensis]